jgi:hypothetical protein
MDDRLTQLRQEILTTMRANNLQVTGEFWFMLVFRTESELIQICAELNITTKGNR